MGREFEYGSREVQPDKVKKEPKFNTERELADIVCIFTSPNQPGLMFYDKSPKIGSPVAKLTGSLPEGKYITDRPSISKVEWDESIHITNGDRIVRFREGSAKVTTVMVSLEKMKEIIEEISKSEDPTRIVIDTRRTLTNYSGDQFTSLNKIEGNEVNYDNFKQARDKVEQFMEQYNKINKQDISSFNNIYKNGKGL